MDHDPWTFKNRLLGLHLAYQAWMKRVDCIYLSAADLLRYFGHSKKVDTWPLRKLKADLEALFPYARDIRWEDGGYSELYLSRTPLPMQFGHDWELADLGVRVRPAVIPSDDELRRSLLEILLAAQFPKATDPDVAEAHLIERFMNATKGSAQLS
jgi:hypothetical protein